MSDGASQQKIVLVVDDEKNIRFTVVHALKSDNVIVESASGGVEGLRKFQERNYDLLLIDLRMPGMTGLEMLREIRKTDPAFPPAVIITAYGLPEQLLEAASLGAIDYIRKPFSIRTIRSLVDEIFERMELPSQPPAGEGAELYLALGKRALMLGEPGKAEIFLKNALGTDPWCAEGHLLLGICSLLEEKERDEPAGHFRRALGIDPANKTASEYLAWLSRS